MRNKILLLLLFLAAVLTGCTGATALPVLEGATHAKGNIHLEGYFTDSEADVALCKVPDTYTAADAKTYCGD